MPHLDKSTGVLYDYGMAFDKALLPRRATRQVTVSVVEGLRISREREQQADRSLLARLIPGINRLK